MNLSLPRIRVLLIASLTTFAVLTVVWWALWVLAATQYRHVIDGWIESGKASGYQITYDDRSLFGFPRHVVLRFTNVQWKNTDNIIFHADDIDIAALPWRWQVFEAKFKKHVEITAPVDENGYALVLGGEDGHAHVELDKDGFWRLSRISLANARFGQTPNYVVTASMLKVSGSRPEQPPKDNKEAGLTLEGEAKDVVLPPSIPSPFGLQMPHFAVDMRVMGDMPDFRKRESTAAWNKESGVVEFNNLHMDWGPLKLTARGTMGFDDDLQPEGAFSGAVGDHDAVLKALMEHNFIAKRQEGMLNSALSLFAKPAKIEGMSSIEIPITVQLGGLFLGPVKVFSFPQIEWPTAAAAAPSTPETPAPAAETPTAAPAPEAAPPATPAP